MLMRLAARLAGFDPTHAATLVNDECVCVYGHTILAVKFQVVFAGFS